MEGMAAEVRACRRLQSARGFSRPAWRRSVGVHRAEPARTGAAAPAARGSKQMPANEGAASLGRRRRRVHDDSGFPLRCDSSIRWRLSSSQTLAGCSGLRQSMFRVRIVRTSRGEPPCPARFAKSTSSSGRPSASSARRSSLPTSTSGRRDEIFPNWVFKRAGELGIFGAHYPEERRRRRRRLLVLASPRARSSRAASWRA